MNGGANELLAALRDIHGAAAPGWWPPAPGWWLLGAAVLIAVSLGARWLGRRWSDRRRRRRFLAALELIDRTIDPAREPGRYLARINRLIRAVALRAFPGRDSARLQGEDWVRFLRSRLPAGAPAEGLEALAGGPYQRAPAFDAPALRAAARAWIRHHG